MFLRVYSNEKPFPAVHVFRLSGHIKIRNMRFIKNFLSTTITSRHVCMCVLLFIHFIAIRFEWPLGWNVRQREKCLAFDRVSKTLQEQ